MNLTQSFRTLILALVLSIGVSYAYATWAPPTATPPLGNIDAPVNVGAGSQTKQGDLSSNSFMSAAQGFFGSVGIGTASVPPSLKLGVAGNTGSDAYCDRDGNNCTAATALGGSGSVAWSSITSRPSGLDDGDDVGAQRNLTYPIYQCPSLRIGDGCNTGGCTGQVTTSSTCTPKYYYFGGAGSGCRSDPVQSCSLLGYLVQ